MTYGMDRALLLESGASTAVPRSAAARHFVRGSSWRMLEPERRLQMIEKALKTPSPLLADGLPVAL